MKPLNVILLSIDCLRYDRCGFNGYARDTTPNLSELAEESVVFDRALSTGPHTSESVPGIIAGNHSFNSAYFQDVTWKAVGHDDTTLASYLSDHGYDTTAVVTNQHLTRKRNFDSGFDSYTNLRHKEDRPTPQKRREEQLSLPFDISPGDIIYGMHRRMQDRGPLNPYILPFVAFRYYQQMFGWPTVPGETVLQELTEQLENCSEPFFGWSHLMDIHGPIDPHVAREGGCDVSNLRQYIWNARQSSGRRERNFERVYEGAVRYVDEKIGEFVQELKTLGVWDNTVLVFTSDHGQALFERGQYGHPRHYLHKELLHVPLLVRIPDGTASRVKEPFSLAWLHELLAEILGIERGDFGTKTNVESHLTSGEMTPVLADSLTTDGHSVTVTDGRYKLFRHFGRPDPEGWLISGDGATFDLRSDPGEQSPGPTEYAPESLREEVEAVRTSPESLHRVTGEFDPDVEERLKQLGYKV